MPLTYTIDLPARIARLRYEGDVTFEEWAAAMTDVLAHPEFRSGFGLLYDRRGASPPSRDYVRRTVEFGKAHAEQLGACRVALVVDNADAYARASMGQILGGRSLQSDIFTDIREAEAWLRCDVAGEGAL
jgi:hypothetical protein